jgi:membrane-bound lytic murein transglycosylase D
MSADSILKLNQELVIHKSSQAVQPSRLEQSAKAITYKVRKGDSLARIASKFKVSVDDIVKWNKIDSKQYLQPGQKLKLNVDVTRT